MIYFVRHGQTDFNLNKIIAGHYDIALNEKGKAQAQQTALDLQGIKFDCCFCSPLMRAKQTCAEILKYHPNLKPVYDNRLKARDYGKMQLQPTNAITFNRWQVGEFDEETSALEIEPIMDLYGRVSDFFDELKKTHPQQNILVIAHSCVGRVASAYFDGIPENQDFTALKIPNAKYVMFEN